MKQHYRVSRNSGQHMTDDLDAGPVKVVTNPLHSMAEDAFLTLEKTIEDDPTLDPFEVHPNASAHS